MQLSPTPDNDPPNYYCVNCGHFKVHHLSMRSRGWNTPKPGIQTDWECVKVVADNQQCICKFYQGSPVKEDAGL